MSGQKYFITRKQTVNYAVVSDILGRGERASPSADESDKRWLRGKRGPMEANYPTCQILFAVTEYHFALVCVLRLNAVPCLKGTDYLRVSFQTEYRRIFYLTGNSQYSRILPPVAAGEQVHRASAPAGQTHCGKAASPRGSHNLAALTKPE